jgi:hypothetical protein
MTFVKFKPLAELKRLARGKKTKVDAQDLAIWALSRIEAPTAGAQQSGRPADDSAAWLERLHRLEDPRK